MPANKKMVNPKTTGTSPSANDRPFVLVANAPDPSTPNSGRRAELFQHALAQLKLPPARLVRYSAWLGHQTTLSREIPAGAIIKVDSPGKDFAVEKSILQLGVNHPALNSF